LERRGLVGAEVVDVERGVTAQALEQRVDERFERLLLLRARRGPVSRVRRRLRIFERQPADQVLEPAALDEGVALEVEEDVGGRGLGETREAETGPARRERLDERARRAARSELYARPAVGAPAGPRRAARGA